MNGPSSTLSCPSATLTRAPMERGIRPPSSIMRPAVISRVASLCMASISSGVGGPEWADVTMYMNRICEFPCASRDAIAAGLSR